MLRYISLIMKKILKKTNKKALDQGRQLKEKKENRKSSNLEYQALKKKKKKKKKKVWYLEYQAIKIPSGYHK